MKIVILDGYTINPGDLDWKALEEFGDLTVYDRSAPSQLIERIGDAEIVFTCKCVITQKIMEACPNIKFISTLATGYDNIDIKAAQARNIAVCNVPAYSTESVAQHTFALLLELCNRVGLHDNAVQEGRWTTCEDFSLSLSPMFQLSGKTLGIIGYGTIGKRVGEIATAFGMNVIPYSKDPEGAIKADVISLHCPATPENKGFINKDFIAKMKDGAMLVNTARGALINEGDLAQAVNSGKLLGAALDVVSKEPIAGANPLLGVHNIIITPHIAWTSIEARSLIATTSAKNLDSFLSGGNHNRIV